MKLTETQEKLLSVSTQALVKAAEKSLDILDKSEDGEDIPLEDFQTLLYLHNAAGKYLVEMGKYKFQGKRQMSNKDPVIMTKQPIINQLDELLNDLYSCPVYDTEAGRAIADSLENMRESIQAETMTRDDIKLMVASELATKIYNNLFTFLHFIKDNDMTNYINIATVKEDIDFYDYCALHLHDLAKQ